MSSGQVVIVQRVLPHYRHVFFRQLQSMLARNGIELNLIYGQEFPGTVPGTLPIDAEWAVRVDNRYFGPGERKLVWQPVISYVKSCDMLIVENANSLLANYVALLYRKFSGKKMAYWGHGRNMQARGQYRVTEWLKRTLLCSADWWFAYTQISADIVMEAGYDKNRITVVQNSIETRDFLRSLEEIGREKIESVRKSLGITGENVLLYCGRLHKNKNIDFVIRSCYELKKRIPDLHVIIIGDGPERPVVESAAGQADWLHCMGGLFGAERAPFFKISKGMLMPSHVGLAVIDSFVSSVPIFSIDDGSHSPEIAYLQHGVNGFMTSPDMDEYVDCIVNYLGSPETQRDIERGCRISAEQYTLANMVARFANGIESCLSENKRVRGS